MIYNGDCLEIMPTLADKSVDMILCDLPYQQTQNKWDVIIPFDLLWKEYSRVCKDNAIICLTASQPFTSMVVTSNFIHFKHEWVWLKNKGSNFLNVKREPFKEHESILIFGNKSWTYNPIKQERNEAGKSMASKPLSMSGDSDNYGKYEKQYKKLDKLRLPTSYQYFPKDVGLHPNQKPVALFEYLIRTYTNEGDTVLDNCAGSFTTAIACMNTNRKYICIEKDKKYFEIGKNRIENHQPLLQAVNQ